MVKEFLFTRPIRGTQTLVVEANTVKEGRELIKAWDASVEGLGFTISHYGYPNHVPIKKGN